MPATFQWGEDTGTATGSPPKGSTRTLDVTNVNWKNSGNINDSYADYPITAGNNSFDKWQFGRFSGTFNQLTAGKFAHTAGSFGTGLTLKGPKSMSADGDNLTYRTPASTTNNDLITDMTAITDIASGVNVWFGATGPEATGKAATVDGSVVRFTNWLTTQLLTTTSASPGDTNTITLTLQYQEN